MKTPRFVGAVALVLLAGAGGALGQSGFINWASAHVSPIAITPDGQTLLAVNTAGATLEVFDIGGASAASPRRVRSIPVGMDPVSVRVRAATGGAGAQAWVVNQISDSVSVIDLPTMRVMRTILTGDEPADVAFAGTGASERAFVTCAQLNLVQVIDPASGAIVSSVPVQGADPRAMVSSADGSRVYVAIFGSGNQTTIVRRQDVSNPAGPYGGVNPPPNSGAAFNPPMSSGLPAGPIVSQIVRRDGSGVWRDDNGRNWSSFVPWNLADNDVAIIDAATLGVTYAKGMLSTVMALGVRPDGVVTAVGLDARNEMRFEPNVRGTFVRVEMGAFAPAAPGTASVVDLNPHLMYSVQSVPQVVRNLSIGDPRAIVWHPTSGRAFVSGMGSNNVIVTDGAGTRYAEIAVGTGPTGLTLSADGARLYCMNKFDGSVSAIDTATNAETARVRFPDPTPATIKVGRPLLYDTHRTSGLGQASCASCHIDGRADFLAWDLGNPAGAIKPMNQQCFGQFFCTDWHPMKGPMVTQTLQGIVGNEPLHWRGDRENVAAFAPAFTGLQGMDAEPTATELTQFTNFIATIKYPPNPNRQITDIPAVSVPTTGGTTGNPVNGQDFFQNIVVVGAAIKCVTCHAQPTGTNRLIDDASAAQQPQSMKMAQLRGLSRKRGFDKSSPQSIRGFGFNHDGVFDTLDDLLLGSGFSFTAGPAGEQQRHDVEAYLLSFPTETHPAIGQQIMFDGTNNNDPAAVARLNTLGSLAESTTIGLIAKGRRLGVDRGWVYLGAGNMQSDRHGEQITLANLRAGAAPGNEVVFMAVNSNARTRLGIDRDEDGFYDAEELAACSNPYDATNFPGSRGAVDVDASLSVTVADIFAFLNRWFAGDARADFNGANGLNVQDIFDYLNAWFAGC